jgi:hypothetical protein
MIEAVYACPMTGKVTNKNNKNSVTFVTFW